MPHRVLLLGVPRSGTTWLGQILGRAAGAAIVNEPDNPLLRRWVPVALGSNFEALPVVEPGDRAPHYERLWTYSFLGGGAGTLLRSARLKKRVDAWLQERPKVGRVLVESPAGPIVWSIRLAAAQARKPPRVVVVKSVFSALAAEWVAVTFTPRVVWVKRHALDVLASWMRMDFRPVPDPNDPWLQERVLPKIAAPPLEPGASRTKQVAWAIGVQSVALEAAARSCGNWIEVTHEDLLANPVEQSQALFSRAGLEWSDSVDEYLAQSNQPGEGFDLKRVWGDLPGRWRRELSQEQIDDATSVLSAFPVEAIGSLD
ncbi:MAG TPA: sulfotransferase [Candidatus Dormibacteraeota bacterium]